MSYPTKSGYVYLKLGPSNTTHARVVDWGFSTFTEASYRTRGIKTKHRMIALLIILDDPDNPPEIKALIKRSSFLYEPGTDYKPPPVFVGAKGKKKLTE